LGADRVRLRLLMVASLLALGAGGCGGDEEEAGGDKAAGEVSFMVFGDPDEIQGFRNMIAAYKREQPGVTVKLIEASDRDDLLARLATSFAGGTPPDLFLLNYRYYGQFASKGVLEPIEDRVEGSDVFQEDDFYEEALQAFRFDGTLTCLPQNISSLVVYYNKDLFRKAGVAEPKAGWTWADMVAAAKKLTTTGKTKVYGLGVEPVVIRLAPFVWSAGGELVDDDESPTHFTLDSPEAQEAMADFFELRLVDEVIPSEEEAESEDLETRFLNGRLAMLLESRRATPTFRSIKTFDWDVAPLPQHEEAASILHADGYCMTKSSKNKDTAWDFMEFALGPDGAAIVAESGRTVPSLKEVAESDVFLDPSAKPASSQVFLDAIPSIRNVPAISTWPEIEDAVEPMMEEALYKGESTEGLAREIRQATDRLFARAEG
jgi:multiple sugar transport system substrate-binding protein